MWTHLLNLGIHDWESDNRENYGFVGEKQKIETGGSMKLSIAIEIESSPEEVFFWLKDPQKAKEWMTSVSETEMLSGTPNTVGATFREIIKDQNGQTEMRGVVTGYQENELISFHLSGQYNTVDVEFRLEKIGERTRVIQNAEVRFRSFMKILSIFLGSAFKKEITAQSQAEFARLKALCERN
jgi:uncharacterized protein YndB with AHSA1/START domain